MCYAGWKAAPKPYHTEGRMLVMGMGMGLGEPETHSHTAGFFREWFHPECGQREDMVCGELQQTRRKSGGRPMQPWVWPTYLSCCWPTLALGFLLNNF